MRIAIVFDDLVQFGGAERLLLGVHEIWPEAPIYTSVASSKWKKICKEKNINLKVSFMQCLPYIEKLNKAYFLLYPLAFESFDFSKFDAVLSISTRFAHGVITKPGTLHVCYMNSPGRMFWEPEGYFENLKVKRKHLVPFLSWMRLWDYSASQRVDYFIANSKTTQRRLKKYYGRDSEVVHPFVDIPENYEEISDGKYLLVISRLVPWKKVDIAIRACIQLEVPLKVVGDGPDRKRLERLSWGVGDVEFLGFVPERKKWSLLRNCKAVVTTQHEDFGIVPLEAMAAGKPVIAYGSGGVLETVIPGETGEFFYEQSVESFIEVLEKFDVNNYDPKLCIGHVSKFERSVFKNKLRRFIKGKFNVT